MARYFDRVSSQYLESSTTPVAAVPFSMGCWFKPDDITTSHTLLALDTIGGSDRFVIVAAGAVAGDFVNAVASAGVQGIAVSSAAFTAGAWQHTLAVFASATSRTVYLNGGNSGTNTTSVTPVPTAVHVGARYNTTIAGFAGSVIAEAGIWDAALTADDALMLASGVSPLLVRPANLVAYWPLMGRNSPEIDPVGGYNLTLANAPTVADHCRIFYPKGLWIPPQKLRISGSVGISFNVPAIAAAGTETISGTAAASFNVPAIAATGTETITGTLAESFNVPAISASGTETIGGNLDVSFDAPAIDASGTETITGTLDVSFDVPRILGTNIETEDPGCIHTQESSAEIELDESPAFMRLEDRSAWMIIESEVCAAARMETAERIAWMVVESVSCGECE